MYDILIKGGTVIDPAQGLHEIRDIAIENGKIAQIPLSTKTLLLMKLLMQKD